MTDILPKRVYFVTGATGFIGNRLARLLLNRGHDVVVLARAPHRARDLKSLGARIVEGDITDRASLRKGMAGADGVFHLAASYTFGRRNTVGMEAINVGGTRNVLLTMRELEIPRGVYTSSTTVFSDTYGRVVDEHYFFEGTHLCEYARTKWIAHYQVARTMTFDGLPLIIVQPSTVYGPGDQGVMASTLTDFLRSRLPMLPSKTMFSWAHVDDVALGHYLAMTRGTPGQSYILSGPSHTLVEAIEMAARIARRRPTPIRASPAFMRSAAQFMQAVESIMPVPVHLTAEALRMSAGCTFTATSEKAERELGYSARSLHTGLKGTLTDLAARIAERTQRDTRR